MYGGVASPQWLALPELRVLCARVAGTFALIALLLGLGAARLARAESPDDERARAHFSAAQEYFAQQRYAEAAAEFDEAYRLSGRPEMLINRARSEERAGQADRAVASLELLFERYPQTSYRAEAEAQLTRLRAELARRSEPGQEAAPAEPDKEKPVALAGTHGKEQGGPAGKRRLWPPRWPTLAVGGTLVATAIVSVATGWAAHDKYERLERKCRPADVCPAAYDFRVDQQRGERLARTSTGFTIASVALAATTIALWIYDVRGSQSRFVLGVRPGWLSARAQLTYRY